MKFSSRVVVLFCLFAAYSTTPSLVWAQSECDSSSAEFAAALRLPAGASKIAALQQVVTRCATFKTEYSLAVAQIEAGMFDAALTTLGRTERVSLDKTNSFAMASLFGRRAQAELGKGNLVAAHESMSLAHALFQQHHSKTSQTDASKSAANPVWFERDVRRAVELKLADPTNRWSLLQVVRKNVAGDTVSKSYGVAPSVDIRITFEFDKASLTSEGRELVDRLVEVINADKSGTNIVFVGHTDERGRADHNQQLSERRADTVMRAVLRAIPGAAPRISSCGRGATSPAFPRADTEELHTLNRRVELSFRPNVCAAK